MKRNDDLAPGDAEQVACQGVTLPWVSTAGERADGTRLSAVHNIHSLFSRTDQMSPDRCATSVLAYCWKLPSCSWLCCSIIFTQALSAKTWETSSKEMNYLLFLKWFSFGEKRSHYSRCSSLEQMLTVAGHSMCRLYWKEYDCQCF